MKITSLFSRLLKSQDLDEDGESEEPLSLDVAVPGRTLLSDCEARKECTVAGTVREIEHCSDAKPATFTLILEDESGASIRITWLGRRSIPGIFVGTVLQAQGTVQGSPMDLTIVDPAYTILS